MGGVVGGYRSFLCGFMETYFEFEDRLADAKWSPDGQGDLTN